MTTGVPCYGTLFYDVILRSGCWTVKAGRFGHGAHIGWPGPPLEREVAMFRNTMPRYEILSPDAIGVLDRGWRRIVSEIGVQFAKPEAVELFRQAGQKVDGEVVFLDPDFVLDQVAKAPREFDVQAR